MLTLQNGVDSADDVAAIVGEPHVLGGGLHRDGARGAGLIVQTGVHRSVIFGEVLAWAIAAGSRRACERRADALAAADIQTTAVPDARADLG